MGRVSTDWLGVTAGTASLVLVVWTAWFDQSNMWDTPYLVLTYASTVLPSVLLWLILVGFACMRLRARAWWALLGAPLILLYAVRAASGAFEISGATL